ncbi:MAG: aspartate aminotransferase family protein [Deltaproteobacteria bacterium]|nr:aspartate aminotransferase family protein [Deltaproteobacteria bacterium]
MDSGLSSREREQQYYLNPFTNLPQRETNPSLVVKRGKGVYVYDEDGREYLEGLSGLWCCSLGFSEERLAKVAYQQMRDLPYYHSFTGKIPAVTVELAERLVDLAPASLSRVIFANSGSESNDTAVKIVWYYNNALGRPEKKKIIARQRGYHGVTVVAGSLTGLSYAQDGFDLPVDRFRHTDCPHHYRHANPGESEEDFATRMAENLDKLITTEGPETIAAFIAEPIQGAGGVIVPPATYFDKIQSVLKKHEVLMIADEVICGFGRTGNMFGSQTYNITPDLMTVAKQLSAAYLPISGLLVSEQVFDALSEQSGKLGQFGHGYTYSGHPVPAAVALETLKIYEEREIVARVQELHPRLKAGLAELGNHPLVGHHRCVGLIGGLEIVEDKASKQSFEASKKVAAFIAKRAQEHGLIVRPLPGDIVACCPPLIISEAEIDQFMERLGKAFDDAAQHFGVS